MIFVVTAIPARAVALLGRNRMLLDQFLDSRDDIAVLRPGAGTVVAPRVTRSEPGSADIHAGDESSAMLREKYETSVVPGKFFEMPEHIRIGIGCDTEALEGGLACLGAALDEL